MNYPRLNDDVIQAINDTNDTQITATDANHMFESVDQVYRDTYDSSANEVDNPEADDTTEEDLGDLSMDENTDISESTDDMGEDTTDNATDTDNSEIDDNSKDAEENQAQMRFRTLFEYGDGTNTHADKTVAPGFEDAVDVAIIDASIGPSEPSNEPGAKEYDEKRIKSVSNGGAGISGNYDGGGDDFGGDDFGNDDFGNDDFGDFNFDESASDDLMDDTSEMKFKVVPHLGTANVFTNNVINVHLSPEQDRMIHLSCQYSGNCARNIPHIYWRAKFVRPDTDAGLQQALEHAGMLAAERLQPYLSRPVPVRVQTTYSQINSIMSDLTDSADARRAIVEFFNGSEVVKEITDNLIASLTPGTTTEQNINTYLAKSVVPARGDRDLARINQIRNTITLMKEHQHEVNRLLRHTNYRLEVTDTAIRLNNDLRKVNNEFKIIDGFIPLGAYVVSQDGIRSCKDAASISASTYQRCQLNRVTSINSQFPITNVATVHRDLAGLETYQISLAREASESRNDCVIQLVPNGNKLQLISSVSGKFYAKQHIPKVVYARNVAYPTSEVELNRIIHNVGKMTIKQLATVTNQYTNVRILVPQAQYANTVGKMTQSCQVAKARDIFLNAVDTDVTLNNVLPEGLVIRYDFNKLAPNQAQRNRMIASLHEQLPTIQKRLQTVGYTTSAMSNGIMIHPQVHTGKLQDGHRVIAHVEINGTISSCAEAQHSFMQYLPVAKSNEYFGLISGTESIIYKINNWLVSHLLRVQRAIENTIAAKTHPLLLFPVSAVYENKKLIVGVDIGNTLREVMVLTRLCKDKKSRVITYEFAMDEHNISPRSVKEALMSVSNTLIKYARKQSRAHNRTMTFITCDSAIALQNYGITCQSMQLTPFVDKNDSSDFYVIQAQVINDENDHDNNGTSEVAGQESLYNAAATVVNTSAQAIVGLFRVSNTLWKKGRNLVLRNHVDLTKLLKLWQSKLHGIVSGIKNESTAKIKITAMPRATMVKAIDTVLSIMELSRNPISVVETKDMEISVGEIAACKHKLAEIGVSVAFGETKTNISGLLETRRNSNLDSLGYTPSNIEAIVDQLLELQKLTDKKSQTVAQNNYNLCISKLQTEKKELAAKKDKDAAELFQIKFKRLAAIGTLVHASQIVLKYITDDALTACEAMEDAADMPTTKLKDVKLLEPKKSYTIDELLNM